MSFRCQWKVVPVMAKPPTKPKPEDIETDPGAWDRFEHAVDAAVKGGPKARFLAFPPT